MSLYLQLELMLTIAVDALKQIKEHDLYCPVNCGHKQIHLMVDDCMKKINKVKTGNVPFAVTKERDTDEK